MTGPKQIDLEPHEYRRGPLHVLSRDVFRHAAYLAAIWFVVVVAFGRLVIHDMPWWVIALPSIAPAALLAFIVLCLDD